MAKKIIETYTKSGKIDRKEVSLGSKNFNAMSMYDNGTQSLDVKIKKLHKNAVIPQYAKPGDAGLDLVAISVDSVYQRREANSFEIDDSSPMSPKLKDAKVPYNHLMYYEYGTGLAIEIPQGYVGLIFPRSSISKKDMTLANSVGVIDSGYRGEIKFRMKPLNTQEGQVMLKNDPELYKVGDKIGQLMIVPYPQVKLVEVEELSDTERGEGGFGSSGE